MSEGLVTILIFLCLGIILLIGAIREWRWLIDPPEEYWKTYTQSFLKKLFGKDFVKIYTIVLSVMFILFSIFFLFTSLLRV